MDIESSKRLSRAAAILLLPSLAWFFDNWLTRLLVSGHYFSDIYKHWYEPHEYYSWLWSYDSPRLNWLFACTHLIAWPTWLTISFWCALVACIWGFKSRTLLGRIVGTLAIPIMIFFALFWLWANIQLNAIG